MIFRKKYPAIFSDPVIYQHPIFAGFNPDTLSEISHFFSEESVTDGAVFKVGGKAKVKLILIKSGKLEIREKINNSTVVKNSIFNTGDSLCEINLLQPDFSNIECRVLEQAELVLLKIEDFKLMSETGSRSTNRFYLNLCNLLGTKLDEINSEFIKLYSEKNGIKED